MLPKFLFLLGDSMVKTFQVYLGVNGGGTNRCSSSSTSSSGGTDSPDAIVVDERTYSCIHCRAHLARHEDLISKSFQGTQGRAYLFEAVVNVSCGKTEERLLLTGLHLVADIYCECCDTYLGWKYEEAYEPSQKYKEGKYIIELAHLIKDNGWNWSLLKPQTR
ncbi:Yippee-like protein [Echinococcus granulosus]|nr:Yippee-like protein [Echinococcus granulosus]